MANTSDRCAGEDRTLQIVDELYSIAELLEPGTRWEIKPGVFAKSIDQRLLEFVQTQLPRLLAIVFTLRLGRARVATQLSFVANMSDVIYQLWRREGNNDEGEMEVNGYMLGHLQLYVALAIYVKMLGVKQNFLQEEQKNGTWMVVDLTRPYQLYS